MPETARAFRSNRILAKLSASDRRELAAFLTPINVRLGEVLNEAGERPEYSYFPVSCMLSVVAVTSGRPSLEVGLVGREGMSGIAVAFGVDDSPAQTIVQGKGTAIRIPAVEFSRALRRNPGLRAEAHRFAYASLATAMLIAACNNEHSLESRLARWLLMTRDRLSTTTFDLTQKFVGQMLGVHRPSVNVVASKLQRRGLINYRRGVVKLLETGGLQEAACDCYPKIRRLSDLGELM